jgi:hypothetical protein
MLKRVRSGGCQLSHEGGRAGTEVRPIRAKLQGSQDKGVNNDSFQEEERQTVKKDCGLTLPVRINLRAGDILSGP